MSGTAQNSGGGGGDFSLPAAPSKTPGLPENSDLIEFDGTDGVNQTNISAAGIDDNELFWCENFFPVGKQNLRAGYGIGTVVYDLLADPRSVTTFEFFSVNGAYYCIIFLSDGSADVLNMDTDVVTTGLPAATFAINSRPAITQYGSKLVVIVANVAPNGFFLFDGNIFYRQGSLGASVDIVNVGSGYSSAPTITAEGGSGTGATFSPVIVNGQIVFITLTNPGSGYQPSDVVTLAFVGGNGTASAIATAGLAAEQVVAVSMVSGGVGYTSLTTVIFAGGDGSGAAGLAQVVGQVGAVSMVSSGTGYSSAPAVGITGANGGGSGASATATVAGGLVIGVTVTAPGSGYLSPLIVTLSGGGGTGAMASGEVTNGVVTGVLVTSGGSGYFSAPTVYFVDPASEVAQATVAIMPFQIAGIAVESYLSRIWVAASDKVFFTAPGSPSDFSPADGGGVFAPTDTALNTGITGLKQSDGFLYIFGGSAISYVSNVQTGGTPLLTTFSIISIESNLGTQWGKSIEVFSKNIMFGTPDGVYSLYGGATQKASHKLDLIFEASTLLGSRVNPSAASSLVFGSRVVLFLFTLEDPTSGIGRQLLAVWNGSKWTFASQELDLIYIRTRLHDSDIAAWGTNGRQIFALLAVPSSTLVKRFNSKLYSKPSIISNKVASQVWMVYDSGTMATLNVSMNVVNETGQAWVTNTNLGLPTQIGAHPKYLVSPLNQVGNFIGAVVSTTEPNLTILKIAINVLNYAVNI